MATAAQRKDWILISDVDDTLLDSNLRWYELYKSYAGQENHPSIEDFRNNGPRYYYQHVINDYDSFKERLMIDSSFNSNMSLMASASILCDTIDIVDGYISTRDESLSKVTGDNLRQLGLPPSPLLLRSSSYTFMETIKFKLDGLAALSKYIQESYTRRINIYYVDDYARLIEKIYAAHYPNVTPIHYNGNIKWSDIISSIGVN